MIDIVFPNKNEEKFIDTALKLGFKKLAFVYSNIHSIKKIETSSIELFYGILANNPNEINKVKNRVDFIASTTNNREIFKKTDLIFNLENSSAKDFIHQRNSGLNHILAKEMKEKEAIYGLNFNMLLNTNCRAIIMGRFAQNIMLCNKYKISIVIGSFASSPDEMRNPEDIISLFECIGVNNGKKAFSALYEKIKDNQFKKSEKYIAEGIRIK